MRIGSAGVRVALTCLLLTSSLLAANPRAQRDQDEEAGRDDPEARAAWFLRGRTVMGESAAALRQRAYQQKLALRELRRRQLQQQAAAKSFGDPAGAQQNPDAQVGAAQAGGTGPNWTQLGPRPLISDPTFAVQDYGNVAGRVTSVVVDQSDTTGNTIYVGAANGGVWKSTNAASANPANVTFTPLIEDQATLAVGSIAIKPDNNQVILVGTGETNNSGDSYYGLGILRSTDGGATWSLITSGDGGTHPFRGMGVGRIAFSTDNPNLVVASMSSAATAFGAVAGAGASAEIPGQALRGLYFSNNAGATWSLATANDVAGTASTSSVVYNPQEHLFYAFIRFHGLYSSANGSTWTRLANQPAPAGSGLNGAGVCPAGVGPTTCPIRRGEIAVRPGAQREMYVWYVDLNATDQGIWRTTDGGATWTQLSESGLTSCIDSQGCGTSQGNYNLYLAAVPNGANTDLYAGAVNIFKCSLAGGACNGWLNLTHVYGCFPFGSVGKVHPDQHAVDFSRTNPNVIYFGNDGGIYRTLNGPGLNIGTCGAGTNPFDNLNASIGSLTQINTFSQHPTDPTILLAGTQDNGSPAIDGRNGAGAGVGGTGGTIWAEANGGDGGFTDIDPTAPSNIWYTANTGVSVQRCQGSQNDGTHCIIPDTFPNIIGAANVNNDSSSFYTPYMLDPQNSARLILGTCRVWRGPSVGGNVNWPTGSTANALSFNFGTGDTTTCSSSADFISALAAGGPTTAAGSEVIYAATSGGRIWVTTTASAGPASWVDTTGPINPSHFPISDVFVDRTVASGLTAYITVMGFGSAHVLKTVNGGQTWSNITGNLPDAPADSVTVDPVNSSIVYVGTDVGVFMTSNNGANWTEYGANLPNVPVSRLRTFSNCSANPPISKLRASTYGRGMFQVDLGSAPQPSPSSVTFASQQVNTPSADQIITLTAGAVPFTITTNATTVTGTNASDFPITANTCNGTIPANTSCTITFHFTPGNTGARTATMNIAPTGAGVCALTIPLSGTGAAAQGPVTPVITSISPGTKVAGTGAFTLTVNGSGFAANSVVRWNGADRTTHFVSSTQITADILAGDVAAAGTAVVLVNTPSVGPSASAAFTITAAAVFPANDTFPFAQLRYWPHIVTGIGYVTKMTVTNLTNASNNVIVYFLDQNGNVLESDSLPTLAGGGTARIATPESARFGPLGIKWAIVNSQAAVTINLFFEIKADPNAVAVVNTIGFNDSPPLTAFTVPVEFEPAPPGLGIGRTIGIAVANPNSTQVTFTVKLLDSSGNQVAILSRNVPARGQIGIDLTTSPEFAAALPNGNFLGSIAVTSTGAVSAIALEDDFGPFSAIPVVPGTAK